MATVVLFCEFEMFYHWPDMAKRLADLVSPLGPCSSSLVEWYKFLVELASGSLEILSPALCSSPTVPSGLFKALPKCHSSL